MVRKKLHFFQFWAEKVNLPTPGLPELIIGVCTLEADKLRSLQCFAVLFSVFGLLNSVNFRVCITKRWAICALLGRKSFPSASIRVNHKVNWVHPAVQSICGPLYFFFDKLSTEKNLQIQGKPAFFASFPYKMVTKWDILRVIFVHCQQESSST